MGFNEDLAGTASDDITALGGESITYVTAAGASSSITALVNREVDVIQRDDRGVRRVREARILLLSADVASPNPDGDYVTFDELDWPVVEVAKRGDGTNELLVRRDKDRLERSGARHRQAR